MDKDTRSAIERATQRARKLLEADFAEQLEGTYDVLRSGVVPREAGAHLGARQRLLRDKILASIDHKTAAGMKPAEAVSSYQRDAAFTALNRFVALKMLEARELVQECITRGDQSAGYKEYCGMAPGVALLPDGAGYRLYLESVFDELSTEVKVLFDRRDAASVLWPRRPAFEELLGLLNAPELSGVYDQDETIGWVYQFFNTGDERRQMRDESQAPRNSRELSVRNQFFTPRYVVEFLTDNTLGRTWCEMRRGESALRTRCQYLVWSRDDVVAKPLDTPDDKQALAWLEGEDVPAPTLWPLAHVVNAYDRADQDGWGEPVLEALRAGRAAELPLQDLLDVLFRLCRGERFCEGTLDAAKAEVDAAMNEVRARVERKSSFRVVRKREKKDPRDLKILDPACGSGHFLLYAFDLLLVIYEEAFQDPGSPRGADGKTLREAYPDVAALRRAVPALILQHNLHGVDIDPRAAQIAALALWLRAQRAYRDYGVAAKERPRIARTHLVVAEPMPGDAEMVKAFAGDLRPPLLGELFQNMVGEMRLAGELGSLLRVEDGIAAGLSAAREQFVKQQRGTGLLPGMGLEARQGELDLSGIDDDGFFHKAEGLIVETLRRFAESAAGGAGVRRRLFAGDAGQGIALIELVRTRFDVVLMNPPFGAGSLVAKKDFERSYPRTKNDLYAAFVERGVQLLHKRGMLGAITSRTGFFLSSFQKWREDVLLKEAPPVVFADLGYGVLDSAMVEVAAYCLEVAT
jgi:hypothetical protein